MNSSSQWRQDTCLGMLGPQVLPGQSPGPPLGAVTSLWDGPWEVQTDSRWKVHQICHQILGVVKVTLQKVHFIILL